MNWAWAYVLLSLGALVGVVSIALVTTYRYRRDEDVDARLPREEHEVHQRESFPTWSELRVSSAPTSSTSKCRGHASVEKRRARKAQRKARRKQRGR